mmetsp:Transcript_30544/g.64929  ORF Transcript_30544/g.64929 Transcript_30544/m.64929 type:complete len:121 (+) Transcript_30544:345-707(+)
MVSSGATIMMTVEGISSAAIAKVYSNPHFGPTDAILPASGWKDIKAWQKRSRPSCAPFSIRVTSPQASSRRPSSPTTGTRSTRSTSSLPLRSLSGRETTPTRIPNDDSDQAEAVRRGHGG